MEGNKTMGRLYCGATSPGKTLPSGTEVVQNDAVSLLSLFLEKYERSFLRGHQLTVRYY